MSQVDNSDFRVEIDEIDRTVIQNIRSHFDDDAILELAESIQEIGLMQAIVVKSSEDEDGNQVYGLVAGERRLRAITYIRENLDEDFMVDEGGVPCVEFTGTDEEARYANAVENLDREDVDDVDLAAWIWARVNEDQIGQTELATRLHKKLQWVNFRHSFHERACQELKDLLRAGLISFTAAYELSKNVDEEGQLKRVKRAIKFNEKISLEEATNAANPNKSSKPSKKQRGTILARLETKAEEKHSPKLRGASIGLRWVDGLITDEEMEEFIDSDDDEEG